MEKRDIHKMMRDAADYNELQAIIAAANEEIKRRQESVKQEYRQNIINALHAANDAGFQIIISDENGEWLCDYYDMIELR